MNPDNLIPSKVSVSTTEVEIVAYNRSRTALYLFNQGADNVKLSFNDDATCYIVLEGGKGMWFPFVPANVINGVTDSGTSVVTVLEG